MKRTTYYRDCPQCHGTGRISSSRYSGGYAPTTFPLVEVTCPRCCGSCQIVDRVVEEPDYITERVGKISVTKPLLPTPTDNVVEGATRRRRLRTTTKIMPRPGPRYACECAAEQGNDFCGPGYCKRPDKRCTNQ
jgi:hypothetical protein